MCTNMAVVIFVIWVPQDWRSREWKPSKGEMLDFNAFLTVILFLDYLNCDITFWILSPYVILDFRVCF